MTAMITIRVHEDLYLRDPEGTELGKKIVQASVLLIDELGFDAFTFKKLAKEIQSTEASVYRYFSSKHQLLCYVVSWYWSWVCYLIEVRTTNVTDPLKKLRATIQALAESNKDDPASLHVDEAVLHRIVMAESARIYMTKPVKSNKQKAFFDAFLSLRDVYVRIFKEINPRYKHPKALALMVISTVKWQIFYSTHFPAMGELKMHRGNPKEVVQFVEKMVLKMVK